MALAGSTGRGGLVALSLGATTLLLLEKADLWMLLVRVGLSTESFSDGISKLGMVTTWGAKESKLERSDVM